jgi:hypothetical protein
VIGAGADGVNGLLETDFDFESQRVKGVRPEFWPSFS